MAEPDDVPQGRAAVQHIASTTNPSPRAAASALAFFMGDEPPPGSEDVITMNIDFGPPGKPDVRSCVFRPIDNEQFVKAAEVAMVATPDGGSRIDPFVNWSVAFAYACVEPDLAPILEARRARGDVDVDGNPFGDTSAIVRSVFRKRPGPLRAVMNKLEAASRMGEKDDDLVQQIEAGKGSP